MDHTTNRSDKSHLTDIYSTHDEESRESWRSMLQNLYSDINNLWQKERLLIRSEINEKVSDIKTAVGSFALGGAFLFLGLFALVAAAIIALDLFLPLWLSAIIVTIALLSTGGVLMLAAKKKIDANHLKPIHSIETLNEIKNTFQERIYEIKRH